MKTRVCRPFSVLSIAATLALGPLSASAETAAPPAAGHEHTDGGMSMGMKGEHSEMNCEAMAENMDHMAEHMGSMHDMMSCQNMAGHMQQMRAMMHHMMSMMVSQIDNRLGSLKTDLKITDAQLPLWNNFADALRSAAKSMEAPHHEKPQAAAEKPAAAPEGSTSYPDAGAIKKLESPAPAEGAMHHEATEASAAEPLPTQLEAHEKKLTKHLVDLKAIRTALDPLYASFSDEQKKVADGLMIGPMGVM
jgi:LTXXQ motif family protein